MKLQRILWKSSAFVSIFTPLLFLSTFLSLSCSKESSSSPSVSKKAQLEILEPLGFSPLKKRIYRSFYQKRIRFAGTYSGEKLSAFIGKQEVKVEKEKNKFHAEFPLSEGLNVVRFYIPPKQFTFEVYRYSKKTQEKLEKLEKGLKEKIQLPPLEYYFEKDIQILPSGTLILEGGTSFYFMPKKGMNVYGTLI
ncbi:MAG: hypothetical protein D6785_01845, partial [Planctomycetota bacterium]